MQTFAALALLAQSPAVPVEVNQVIDARLVGAFLAIFTGLLFPLVKWLGGMAVSSAFEKITGLGEAVDKVAGDVLDQGKKAETALRTAELAAQRLGEVHKKLEDSIEPRVSELEIDAGKLEGRVDRAEKDVLRLDDRLQRAAAAMKVS